MRLGRFSIYALLLVFPLVLTPLPVAGQIPIPGSAVIQANSSVTFRGSRPPVCPTPRPSEPPPPCPPDDRGSLLVSNRSNQAANVTFDGRVLTIAVAPGFTVDILERDMTHNTVQCLPPAIAASEVQCRVSLLPNVSRVGFTVIDDSVGFRVSYAAGLNLIGAPSGTVVDAGGVAV